MNDNKTEDRVDDATVDEQAQFEQGFLTAQQTGEPQTDTAPETVSGADQAVPQDESKTARAENQVDGQPEADGVQDDAESDVPRMPLDALDEDTVKTLLANSARAAQLEQLAQKQSQELRRVYGKIGELNSRLQQLQRQPARSGIRQVELRFERLSQEYPELAELLREDLSKALSAAEQAVEQGGESAQDTGASMQDTQDGQATAPAEAPMHDEAVDAPDAFAERELQLRMEYEQRLLDARHPDFREIARSPDFEIWLASQPPQVQAVVRNSWSADELAQVFDMYKTQVRELQRATAQVKAKRLEAAVTPEATSAPSSTKDEVDEFLEGFNAVARQRI